MTRRVAVLGSAAKQSHQLQQEIASANNASRWQVGSVYWEYNMARVPFFRE